MTCIITIKYMYNS